MNAVLSLSDYALSRDLLASMSQSIQTGYEFPMPSSWAEKRTLPNSLTPHPGPVSFDVCPYLREIVDCFAPDSDVREVACLKGTQVLFTTSVLENAIGYTIDVYPGPTLYVTSDAEMAEKHMDIRIDALIQASGIGAKIGASYKRPGQRKTGDGKATKQFPGGYLDAIGPNSASKLRGFSYRIILCDEVDAFPQSVGDEGETTSYIRRRADAYTEVYKILWGSTALLKHTSRIDMLYEQGDKRKYFVPCKKCKKLQFLKWGQLKFEHTDDHILILNSVYYECEFCKARWRNSDKDWFLSRGEWRATATPRRIGMRSYHIPALYSPVGFRSWEHGITEFLDLKRRAFPKKEYQNFVNTFLAEAFVDLGEQPKIEALITRERNYHIDTLPDSAHPFFVTIAADVQKDRIEAEVVAWGWNAESWSLNYHVFGGDTENPDDPPWQALKNLILAEHCGMKAILSGVDSGFRTSTAYSFCEQFEGGVYPVMGAGSFSGSGYFRLFTVRGSTATRIDFNTDLLKQKIYEYLNRSRYEDGRAPIGYCNFPAEYKRDHFLGLTSESRVATETKSGVRKYVWIQSGKNEKLDVRVYGLGLVHALKEFVREEYGYEAFSWEEFWAIATEFRS